MAPAADAVATLVGIAVAFEAFEDVVAFRIPASAAARAALSERPPERT